MTKFINNKNHNYGIWTGEPSSGRPAAYRWPGFEMMESLTVIPKTRAEELALAKEEAARREKEYSGGGNEGGGTDNANSTAPEEVIEIDFDAMRFDLGGKAAHTTIDFDKITDETGLAVLTTNDFVVFNKIKKILFGAAGAAAQERGWDIIDLKLNSTGSALYFVTVQLPVGELKKVLNKY